MNRKLLPIIVSIILLLFVYPGCSPSSHVQSGATVDILYTGNVNGELQRCGCSDKQLGGVARRMTMIEQLRTEQSLLLDAGDLFFSSFEKRVGSTPFYRDKSSTMIRAMNLMGYDGAMIGDYDFAEGKDFLLDTAVQADFPFICANLLGPDGKPVFASHRVVNRGGLRIGIVGFLDSNVVTEPYRKALGTLRIQDPLETARQLIPAVAKESDVIVALLHFNIIDVKAFLAATPEIQVAILGHTVGEGKAEKVGRAWIVSGGRLGKELGRVTLKLDAQGRVVDVIGELIPIPEELAEESTVHKEVVRFNQRVTEKRYSDHVRYESPSGGEQNFLGADTCLPCHPIIHQQWSNTSHAFAMDTLIEEGYAFNPECVICHVVGYGDRSGFVSRDKTPRLAGVQCESCHGAGKEHVSGKPMKPGVPEEVCVRCHTDVHSPGFEYFSYSARSDQCTLP